MVFVAENGVDGAWFQVSDDERYHILCFKPGESSEFVADVVT